ATILSSNTLVHKSASRFGPALRLSGQSWAESAAFGALRLNPSSTPVQLGEPIQWVKVNRFNGLTNPWFTWSTGQLFLTSQHRSTTSHVGQPSVNGGRRWSTSFFSSGSSQEVKRLYMDFANSDHRKFYEPICEQLWKKF
ncbi:hypothetical protein PIB30_109403, partial [Stylosanthes scabra]|nr:hypothetical protein [Stylosanthes scabra]